MHIMWHFRKLKLPGPAETLAEEKDFEIAGYRFTAEREQTRQPRVVRVGVIQNKIVIPTNAPIAQQVNYLLETQKFLYVVTLSRDSI